MRIELKVKKIHRVLEFNQSQWLKPYVKFNTHTKKNRIINAKENGDKDRKALYKLMNNVVYGKAMENVRNKIDIKLVSNEKNYMKRTSKPSYMSQKIFDNNLVAIRISKVTLTLNKQAYVGMCILDLSKYCCMDSIMITLKIDMVTIQDYYLLALIKEMK